MTNRSIGGRTRAIPGHSPPRITPGTSRRRATRLCLDNGRFPYTGMTGSPAKIIASANGLYGSSRNPA